MFIVLSNNCYLNLDHVAKIDVFDIEGNEGDIEMQFCSDQKMVLGTYKTTRAKLKTDKIFKEIFSHNRSESI